jgi:hypothetical protein
VGGTTRTWIGCLGIACATACYSGRETGTSAADGATGDGDDGATAADSGEGPGEPAVLECEDIGAQPLRRISSAQYLRIVGELLPGALGEEAVAMSTFPATMIDTGFSTFATANSVSSAESIAIEDNAELLAQLFFDGRADHVPALVPCVSAGYMPEEIDGCIEGFVDEFGARAFRRPLTEGERAIMLELYQGVADEDGQEAGLTAVLHWVLQAPPLLYAVERGLPTEGSYAALDSWELATRLSLFLRNSAPDAELAAAAADGRLVTRDDVEREARRLVSAPEAIEAIGRFHREWMEAYALETDDRTHELYSPDTRAAMLEEVDRFTAWFLAETDGSFATLMTASTFPVDDRLAAIYGLDAGVDGGGDPIPHRSGLLTLASVMAAQAHENRTSLIERGAFVRNHVLCSPTPPFPGNIDPEATLGDHSDLPTARERYQPLMDTQECSGCHMHINPFGFAFEVYDWAGAYRATENGAPIDTSFPLEFGSIEGDFANAAELLAAMAASEEAQSCYATHAFRYAMGRMDTPADECALDEIQAAFVASGGDVRELMVAITTSDAFMFRAVGGAP